VEDALHLVVDFVRQDFMEMVRLVVLISMNVQPTTEDVMEVLEAVPAPADRVVDARVMRRPPRVSILQDHASARHAPRDTFSRLLEGNVLISMNVQPIMVVVMLPALNVSIQKGHILAMTSRVQLNPMPRQCKQHKRRRVPAIMQLQESLD
jgi:hypothetical protein